jgi:replication initiation protein RepC
MKHTRSSNAKHTRQQSTHDPRWHALNIVQSIKESLGLRDRDIAVLRGLLTFIRPEEWLNGLMVYASNASLQSRCDGIDERTLRRRLAKLCDAGLVTRHQSPNRKRYVVRDEQNQVILAYGFDLLPLRNCIAQLELRAAEQRVEEAKILSLKAILRDRLYKLTTYFQTSGSTSSDLRMYNSLLRRKASVEALTESIYDLENILSTLDNSNKTSATATSLTDSVRQTDRHIQSSNKEYNDKEEAEEKLEAYTTTTNVNEIGFRECLDASTSAMEYTTEKPQNWSDLDRLALLLGPAIGLAPSLITKAYQVMGKRGGTLAILGMVQAFPRIKKPNNYLQAILTKASSVGLNIQKMFRSLTQEIRFPAGNQIHEMQES